MKLLDMVKMAVKTKQHIHRVPGNTRAGKQLRSRNSTRDIIQTGQGKHDNIRLAESIKGTNGKRNI